MGRGSRHTVGKCDFGCFWVVILLGVAIVECLSDERSWMGA